MNMNFAQARKTRREALGNLVVLPLVAMNLTSFAQGQPKISTKRTEDIITQCSAGVTACEHLAKGQHDDMNLAYAVLTTYLAPLKAVVEESSPHRKEASRLVAQALLCKATLSLHKEGPKRAIGYGKQAAVYAKESQDIPLRLMVLKKLAWIYGCNNQEKQALETALQAKSLLLRQQKQGIPIHPFIQSSVYGRAAEYQACNGQDEDALATIRSAYDTFFAQSQEDTTAFYADFNHSDLILDDGLTNCHLEKYDQALSLLEMAIDFTTFVPKVPTSSERVRIEIINCATLASLKRPTKDIERSIQLWTAGMQGAIDLRSEQRFNEALMAYNIMQALWPGDKRIKELRDLTRHW